MSNDDSTYVWQNRDQLGRHGTMRDGHQSCMRRRSRAGTRRDSILPFSTPQLEAGKVMKRSEKKGRRSAEKKAEKGVADEGSGRSLIEQPSGLDPRVRGRNEEDGGAEFR